MEDREKQFTPEGARFDSKPVIEALQGEAKLPFEPPKLVVHGEVKELTAGTFGASV